MKRKERKPGGLKHQILSGLLLGALVLSSTPFSALAAENSDAAGTDALTESGQTVRKLGD